METTLKILSISGISFLGIYNLFLYFTGKDPYRKDFVKRLRASQPSFSTYYQTYLQKGLEKLQEWLGAPFSTKALFMNTFLAILYAISFFAASWVTGSSGKIGTISILSESLSTIERSLIILLLLVVACVLSKHIKIDSAVEKLLSLKISSNLAPLGYRLTVFVLIICIALVSKSYLLLLLLLISLYRPTLALTVTLALKLAFLSKFAGGLEIAIPVAIPVAMPAAFLVAVAVAISCEYTGAGKFAVAVTAAVAITAAVAFSGVVAFPGEKTSIVDVVIFLAVVFSSIVAAQSFLSAKRKLFLALYTCNVFLICFLLAGLSLGWMSIGIDSNYVAFLFLVILLPFINGFMDFVSLGISRILSKKIYEDIKHGTYKAIILHLAIDLVAAVLLLVFLVFTVCFGTQLFNIFVAKEPELFIDLSVLIKSAKQSPFGPDGLWITLMLLSTLVPTFAHFVIAFAGTFTVFTTPKLRNKLADLLEQKRNALPALYYTGKILFGLLFAIALWGLVGYGINYMASFADMLSKIAYWSIDLANKIPH